MIKLARMRRLHRELINTPAIEFWPTHLVRARGSGAARALALAEWVLRRKRDGRFLAVAGGEHWQPLLPTSAREPGLAQALRALTDQPWRDLCQGQQTLGPKGQDQHLLALGINADYGALRDLSPIAEPRRLRLAGFDRYRRPLWLLAQTANAWQQLRLAAHAESILLEAISGYRSIDYQRGIFERKLARGMRIEDILGVNAAPGYSEHHSGRAIDISCQGEPAAETSFELTSAFAWLSRHAGEFGFVMSYPRDNRHGVMFEPWHWCWQPPH